MHDPPQKIVAALERARLELLDLSARNRLLSTPRRRSRTKTLEIVDELSSEIFRLMVHEGKALAFLPSPEDADVSEVDETSTGQAVDDAFAGIEIAENDLDERGVAARHRDLFLQTILKSDKLYPRLLSLYYDARTYEEEQGVNILYLALGFLRWFDVSTSETERFAPLVLIPVVLERQGAGERFKLRYTEEEISTNLSLQAKLTSEFGIDLPELPDAEDLDVQAYFAAVQEATKTQDRWKVLDNDIVLGFFAFQKFLMYRDLDSANWPDGQGIHSHKLVSGLLGESMKSDPPLCADDAKIDEYIGPEKLVHILDADSSQCIAIEEARLGRNLVIQGPPGTGKSQTIANIIATAVKEGKTVLFMAEKMAALDVVKVRLDNVGLGELCLELHSHKANKRRVLEDLAKTLRLDRPQLGDLDTNVQALTTHQVRLNSHADLMHVRHEKAQISAYRAIGEMIALQRKKIGHADFSLKEMASWSPENYRARSEYIGDLAERIEEIGIPSESMWRGVQASTMLPMDLQRLHGKIEEIVRTLLPLLNAVQSLCTLCRFEKHMTLDDLNALTSFSGHVSTAPEVGRQNLDGQIWREDVRTINSIVSAGRAYAAAREKLEGKLIEDAWSTNVTRIRQHIAGYGRSFFRIFNSQYRRAIAEYRGLLTVELPRSYEPRVELLDSLILGQRAAAELDTHASAASVAFRDLWCGFDTDWDALDALATWQRESHRIGLPSNFYEAAARIEDMSQIKDLAEVVNRVAPDVRRTFEQISDTLNLDPEIAFGVSNLGEIPLKDLAARVASWLEQPESITKWIVFHAQYIKAQELSLDLISEQMWDGRLLHKQAGDFLRFSYLETILRDLAEAFPDLAAFDGASHEQTIERFGRLDIKRIELARHEVALSHFDRLPRSDSAIGQMGVVMRELQKKRRHLPLRKLLQQACGAIQAIKPVFMMSPMSIAQFLTPGAIQFDLLLIDEASQVQPVDALGGIARSSQIAIVGDERQLPPTRFFARGFDGDPDSEDEAANVGDLESILGLCVAQGIPSRMLNWHYRSRHHSLIAVSNQEFYNSRLCIVPSPFRNHGGLGLQFHLISNGVFDRGKSATNRREAQAVAQAVMEHAKSNPDRSLGVGTFSIRQRDAILEELELLWQEQPDLRDFFATGKGEPFFVKNLENIQGDERDVIFISVGYGPDQHGYMAMNFGPLSREGGERRLNVLISRARLKCVVYSSITAEDIDLHRAKGRGTAALKTFLNFAQTGSLDVGMPTGRDYDSLFEREVALALQRHGHIIEAQVGIAGFFIDLAVVDPENPGRYILGIECDGAAYHSARSARDRDRLRQQVLEDHGWRIHRIWSTDWFYRPQKELERALEVIEQICRTDRSDLNTEIDRKVAHQSNLGRLEESPVVELETDDSAPSFVQVYKVATFAVNVNCELHELPTPRMAELVERIVEIEGPIHQEEVARRVSNLWKLKRTGNRIAKAVRDGLDLAVAKECVSKDDDFYDIPNRSKLVVRDRSKATAPGLRRPEMLPPAEIAVAVETLVRENAAVPIEELIIAVSRVFGFKSTGGSLRTAIKAAIPRAVKDGKVREQAGVIYPTPN